jgi:hypothetical protein
MSISIDRKIIEPVIDGRALRITIDDHGAHVELSSANLNHTFCQISDSAWLLEDCADFHRVIAIINRDGTVCAANAPPAVEDEDPVLVAEPDAIIAAALAAPEPQALVAEPASAVLEPIHDVALVPLAFPEAEG